MLALKKKAIPVIKQPKNVPLAETCIYARINLVKLKVLINFSFRSH
jgi:hypothetical protein